MKAKSFATLVSAASITLGGLLVSQFPSQAQTSNRFSCGTSNGMPATVAHTSNGSQVPVIVWESNYFEASGYSPQVRCQMVSERFEAYYRDGSLNRLQGGYMNGMPVVCTSGNGGSCGNLLFTLKLGTDPSQALADLTNVRNRASSAMYESVNGGLSIDLEMLIREAEPADYSF
ncbi:COP23 domain-containing protein [Phormidium yuhuli AB48]|uniref:COP23 domain-containing protein n=1 Tax=Phormidium yuhuli AB48 TaxID=2940671 RepID=A0ABY5AMQ7_9CYAN|nr:COP23 domain-containing protein [Phormidium yuhuli]USR90100.1 COP23 domain-containing protein [Phormidium yuhuli AB48]